MADVILATALGVLAICVVVIQFSWWLVFVSAFTFILGYISSDYFLRYADGIPDIFGSVSNATCGKRRRQKCVDPLNACTICGSENCNRSHAETCSTQSADGMLNPKIAKLVDDALHEFLDLTLKTYVDNWYESFISREDKAFVKQLRVQIRHALCRSFLRLKRLDLSHVILDEILPVAINHAAVYADTKKMNQGLADNLEDRVLERMSSLGHLHPAMRSRVSELSYIKRIVEFLITNIADKSLSTTMVIFLRELFAFEICLPGVDAVADPDVINRILELFFDPLPMRTFDGELSEDVVLLNRFVDEKNPNALSDTVVFQVKLSEIIRDPSMLYAFMSYLKSVNAPMNWLQFILSAHDIQEHLHSGRLLSKEDISHLHWQSWELYRNYLHEGAPDKLGDDVIPASVVQDLKQGVESGSAEHAVTIIGPILEHAYQIVYELVQWRYTTPFCYSSKFMELICASRHHSIDYGSDMLTVEVADRQNNVSPTPSDKQPLIPDDASAGLGFNSGSGSGSGSDEEESEIVQQRAALAVESTVTAAMRDLSQWKACLPRIEPRRDPQTGRTMYVYVVEVDAPDAATHHWCIDRRYREFYVLESKLVEFHGDTVVGGFPLPPKKTFNNKSRAFLESQRAIFDQFLKRLLHNPALKGSEMLHAFLTSPNELTVSFLPDPFKVMRKMPGKLARERGQNLSPFLNSLVSAVLKVTNTNELKPPEAGGRVSPFAGGGRTSPFSVASSSSGGSKTVQDKLFNTQYKNNFDILARSTSSKSEDMSISTMSDENCLIKGVYDALIFLAHKIFRISTIPWTILVSARTIARGTFDGYVYRFLKKELDEALHEQRLVMVIHALRDLVFFEDTSPRSDDEKIKRKQSALALAMLYFDTELSIVQHIIGKECFKDGVNLIFECLQYPRLNKQLLYMLLDVVAREIFPELT